MILSNHGDPIDQASTDLTGRLNLFADVCSGLSHMHKSGYVHRDIKVTSSRCEGHCFLLKPTITIQAHNILIEHGSARSVAKIADLGTAVKLKHSKDLLHEPVGTTGYSGWCIVLRYLRFTSHH